LRLGVGVLGALSQVLGCRVWGRARLPVPRRHWVDSCVDAGRALTALYGAGAEPGRLQWHARHKSERTTRRYVQELGASVVLARLPAARREAIVELARTAPILLRAVTAELRAPPRPSSPVVPRRGPA